VLYKTIYNATESKMALKDKNKTAESRETAYRMKYKTSESGSVLWIKY
jgi:hypothetical protein